VKPTSFKNVFRLTFTAVLLTALIGCQSAQNGSQRTEAKIKQPNIIVIMVDDLGYSDLGSFGGEIQTPHLDSLAEGGLRMTQFYNSARCCPSRVSLLTGLHPQQAGIGNMLIDRGFPGYRGVIADHCVMVPQVLREANYFTAVSGKWHVNVPGPMSRGVDAYYGFKNMRAHSEDSWDEGAFIRLPEGEDKRSYKPSTFYATDAITDHAIDFLAEARERKQPCFLYMAYNAPHFPLHAPKELIDKYQKTYEKGWDKIREQRYQRMQKLGLVSKDWPLTPRSIVLPNRISDAKGLSNTRVPAWDGLDEARRIDLARRMATYAAMVDSIDQNIGRMIDDLEKAGELDNTLILFFSDNGASGEHVPFGFDIPPGENKFNKVPILNTGKALENMGQAGNYMGYGTGWACASNTPLSFYKRYVHEGGISTPFIAHWPKGIRRSGEIDRQPAHITDIMATCVDITGANYPKQFNGNDILPMEGLSLMPIFRGEQAPTRTLCFDHENTRAVRQGKWKLVKLREEAWELYDMEQDRVEMNNLAKKYPQRVEEMAAIWKAWAKRCQVLPGPIFPKSIPAPPGKQ
jgi:arylsulfatase